MVGTVSTHRRRNEMPAIQTGQQTTENLNVKLVHSTKQHSPDSPLQLAFSVTDESGNEQIETAEIPNGQELYQWCAENRYITQSSRPSVRSMRRAVAS